MLDTFKQFMADENAFDMFITGQAGTGINDNIARGFAAQTNGTRVLDERGVEGRVDQGRDHHRQTLQYFFRHPGRNDSVIIKRQMRAMFLGGCTQWYHHNGIFYEPPLRFDPAQRFKLDSALHFSKVDRLSC